MSSEKCPGIDVIGVFPLLIADVGLLQVCLVGFFRFFVLGVFLIPR